MIIDEKNKAEAIKRYTEYYYPQETPMSPIDATSNQTLTGTIAPTQETPMTPDERLLKAAKADLERWNEGMNSEGKQDTWRGAEMQSHGMYYPIMLELEAAVKECEATKGMQWTPIPEDGPEPDTLTDQQRRLSGKGRIRWNKDKTGVCAENIEFETNEIWVAVINALTQLSNKSDKTDGLSDSQRRLGLRSTRHMGKDYPSPEYD